MTGILHSGKRRAGPGGTGAGEIKQDDPVLQAAKLSREGRRMQCVILAGGLGTRMRPLTDRLPKTLLPVRGTPFAHFQLNWLAEHGVTEVIYSIAVLGEMIEDYV